MDKISEIQQLWYSSEFESHATTMNEKLLKELDEFLAKLAKKNGVTNY